MAESGREISETTIDVFAHGMAFLLTYRIIESPWYKVGSLVLTCGILYRYVIGLKFFVTQPKMMPPPLQRLFDLASIE